MDNQDAYSPGEVVYVIIRNPHAQDVANVQQAAIVHHPQESNQLALFLHETYYPLTNDVAVYRTEYAAEQAFQEAFSITESGEWYG